jgi:hypothetical protein
VVFKNFSLFNKLGIEEFVANAPASCKNMADVLYHRGEVFDLGTDFYYFYDRFDWNCTPSGLILSLKDRSRLLIGVYADHRKHIEVFIAGLLRTPFNTPIFKLEATQVQLDIMFSAFGVDQVLSNIFSFVNWLPLFQKVKQFIVGLDMKFPYEPDGSQILSSAAARFVDSHAIEVAMINGKELESFDESLFTHNYGLCTSKDTREVLRYSKYQHKLRLDRSMNVKRDSDSKIKSRIKLNLSAYHHSIIQANHSFFQFHPGEVSFTMDIASFKTTWAFSFMQDFKDKVGSRIVYKHHLSLQVPESFYAYPGVRVEDLKKPVLTRSFINVDYDINFFDLVTNYVTHGTSSWYCSSQQHPDDISLFLRPFTDFLLLLRADLDFRAPIDHRSSRMVILRIPYFIGCHANFYTTIARYISYDNVLMVPSLCPHEEFFYLFLKMDFTLLPAPIANYNAIGYDFHNISNSFCLAVHRRQWFYDNSAFMSDVVPISDPVPRVFVEDIIDPSLDFQLLLEIKVPSSTKDNKDARKKKKRG